MMRGSKGKRVRRKRRSWLLCRSVYECIACVLCVFNNQILCKYVTIVTNERLKKAENKRVQIYATGLSVHFGLLWSQDCFSDSQVVGVLESCSCTSLRGSTRISSSKSFEMMN